MTRMVLINNWQTHNNYSARRLDLLAELYKIKRNIKLKVFYTLKQRTDPKQLYVYDTVAHPLKLQHYVKYFFRHIYCKVMLVYTSLMQTRMNAIVQKDMAELNWGNILMKVGI